MDAFIPRAETLAKSKMDRHHNHSTQEQQSTSDPKHQEIRYRPTQPPTEMHMGLFDLNIFHGSGSGGSKEALDEQVSLAANNSLFSYAGVLAHLCLWIHFILSISPVGNPARNPKGAARREGSQCQEEEN